MEASPGVLPLLRLLHITDSSFPVGGYAYSHGLEWLVADGRANEPEEISEVLRAFVAQTVGRQWLPAAAMAFRARTVESAALADLRLDASISASAEREAGRAMGCRLLDVATQMFDARRTAELRELVRAGRSPGQFAVAFGALASDIAVLEAESLGALGYSMVNSITQAAIRLGVIGADAGARLVAQAMPAVDAAARSVAADSRPNIGSFSPLLEMASLLQPTLKFRMFAS
ncbi:MAG: urease accessory protein UreF [Dehalococcoidia bacterium]